MKWIFVRPTELLLSCPKLKRINLLDETAELGIRAKRRFIYISLSLSLDSIYVYYQGYIYMYPLYPAPKAKKTSDQAAPTES